MPNTTSKTLPAANHLRAVHAAVEGLTIHSEACGHVSMRRDCGYCDDRRTVTAARKALKALSAMISKLEGAEELARASAPAPAGSVEPAVTL